MTNALVVEASPWQQTRVVLVQFGFRLLTAVVRAAGLVALIFVHRAIDWALATAFRPIEWTSYYQWLQGGTFVGFSLIYAMLMFEIGVLFWPFNKK